MSLGAANHFLKKLDFSVTRVAFKIQNRLQQSFFLHFLKRSGIPTHTLPQTLSRSFSFLWLIDPFFQGRGLRLIQRRSVSAFGWVCGLRCWHKLSEALTWALLSLPHPAALVICVFMFIYNISREPWQVYAFVHLWRLTWHCEATGTQEWKVCGATLLRNCSNSSLDLRLFLRTWISDTGVHFDITSSFKLSFPSICFSFRRFKGGVHVFCDDSRITWATFLSHIAT